MSNHASTNFETRDPSLNATVVAGQPQVNWSRIQKDHKLLLGVVKSVVGVSMWRRTKIFTCSLGALTESGIKSKVGKILSNRNFMSIYKRIENWLTNVPKYNCFLLLVLRRKVSFENNIEI